MCKVNVKEGIHMHPSYDLSRFHNEYDATEIIGLWQELNAIAYYLAGNDEMDLKTIVSKVLEQSMDEYNPARTYCKDYDTLDELIKDYNESVLSEPEYPLLSLEVDTEKTNTLRDGSFYKIHKIAFTDQ